MIETKLYKISDIKPNPNNPRIIKDDKFLKLVNSIKNFPEMLKLRPIVINEDNVVLGGNMRLKACKEAKLTEIPVILAGDLTEDQQREFIIKDNVGYGEWDFQDLAENWDSEELELWGLDLPESKEPTEDGEIIFSNELDQESNYIVLKFSTDIDWLQVQSIFGLKSTHSKRANGKPWSKGVGRVIDGTEAIIKIKSSSNEG